MPKRTVILVGGFLGAGKTTLIAAAVERLSARGKRVGVITNDQAASLVDTASLTRPGLAVQEVAGGCFCCRFDDLVAAMERIVESESPDLLIGEPVGSCTDLSATVLQPLKRLLADRFAAAPFSVVVDGTQLRSALQDGETPRFPENVLYIYRKQLEEADMIVLNKVDLLDGPALSKVEELLRHEFPQTPVMALSAKDGTGVDAWLDHVLTATEAGKTVTEVDYDVYADGEAALGWLNASVSLQAQQKTDWPEFCSTFMEAMRGALREADAEIAHLKLHVGAGAGANVWTANLTSNDGGLSSRGEVPPSFSKVRLLINARAHVDPDRLRSITERCLAATTGDTIRFEIDDLRHFVPARPTPTHRYDSVVES